MTATYEEILDWLYNLEARRGMDFRLARLEPVLDRLGHPERAFACVHVAGTNGKGSTSAMIESALRAGGYRTGLYTSPHLVSFRERIRIANRGDRQSFAPAAAPISRREVVSSVTAVRVAMEAARQELTFFEIVTLAAFVAMRAREVEVAVIEAGLGGRLDATNVARGEVCAITSIGIDHAEYLGDTIEKIAFEKAGIVKPGSVLVTGALPAAAMPVIEQRIAETGARWLAYGRDFGDFAPMAQAQRQGRAMLGEHQLRNAAVAQAALAQLDSRFPVAPEVRERAIVEARWPGRLEIIDGRPPVILDAAHNPEAAAVLARALEAEPSARRPRVLVFAAMADKDWRSMLEELRASVDAAVFVALPMTRAQAPQKLCEAWPSAHVASSPEEGLALARELSTSAGSVVVAGSIFLLGHLYRSAGGAFLEQDLSD
ncbi:MAG TPA: folylpolyglutamate synthase/dihydrofolate synthase family protein [Candidatus Binatia bacterium]|nr:folylpolyglutamate synthase/dihydrofolate synthase family protein [Candidatus Binatia bacterium]